MHTNVHKHKMNTNAQQNEMTKHAMSNILLKALKIETVLVKLSQIKGCKWLQWRISRAEKCLKMRPHLKQFPLAKPRTLHSFWKRKSVSLLSSAVVAETRLPISYTSSMACWLHEPAVLMATGKEDVGLLKFLILRSFDCCLLSCRALLSCFDSRSFKVIYFINRLIAPKVKIKRVENHENLQALQ